jgi:hypothetical protein
MGSVPMRKIPNLFLVGAARSGTTSLWRCLQSHPQVFMPGGLLQKEPAYFSSLKRSRFKRLESYLALFAPADERHLWVGEASTAYLTDPDSARRIHEYNPEARIIIMLRHPAQRAYSLYNWMVQEGYEYAGTFAEALKLEDKRIAMAIPNCIESEYYYNYLYFHSGLYSEQVKRYVDLFKDRVLIVKFEDYFGDFSREFERICRFLNVETLDAPDRKPGDDLASANQSKRVHSSVLQYALRKMNRYYFSHVAPFGAGDDAGHQREHLGENGVKRRDMLRRAFFDQMRRELRVLEKQKKIKLTERLRIFCLLRRIVGQLDQGAVVPRKTSKSERDVWLKMGQIDQPPSTMNDRTVRCLRERYKSDIALLAEYTGIDFSSWTT